MNPDTCYYARIPPHSPFPAIPGPRTRQASAVTRYSGHAEERRRAGGPSNPRSLAIARSCKEHRSRAERRTTLGDSMDGSLRIADAADTRAAPPRGDWPTNRPYQRYTLINDEAVGRGNRQIPMELNESSSRINDNSHKRPRSLFPRRSFRWSFFRAAGGPILRAVIVARISRSQLIIVTT